MSNILEKADALIQGAQDMKSEISLFGDEQKAAGNAEGYANGYAQGKNDGYDQGIKDAQAGNGGDPLKIYTLDDLNQFAAEEKAKQAAEDAAVLASVKGELDQRLIDAQDALSQAQAINQAAIDSAVSAKESELKAQEDAAVLASVKAELDQRLIDAQNALSQAQASNQAAIDSAVSAKESELKAQFASELAAVDADNEALKSKYSN